MSHSKQEYFVDTRTEVYVYSVYSNYAQLLFNHPHLCPSHLRQNLAKSIVRPRSFIILLMLTFCHTVLAFNFKIKQLACLHYLNMVGLCLELEFQSYFKLSTVSKCFMFFTKKNKKSWGVGNHAHRVITCLREKLAQSIKRVQISMILASMLRQGTFLQYISSFSLANNHCTLLKSGLSKNDIIGRWSLVSIINSYVLLSLCDSFCEINLSINLGKQNVSDHLEVFSFLLLYFPLTNFQQRVCPSKWPQMIVMPGSTKITPPRYLRDIFYWGFFCCYFFLGGGVCFSLCATFQLLPKDKISVLDRLTH